jgi:ATP-dependent exoDNAse (exonuclease V) alpha subunit
MSTPSNLSPQQVSAFPQHETITGVVERLTFYSAESGYTVARLTRPRSTELTTIVGSFANIQPGQTLQLIGFWRDHPQFGPQFQVVNYNPHSAPLAVTQENYGNKKKIEAKKSHISEKIHWRKRKTPKMGSKSILNKEQ